MKRACLVAAFLLAAAGCKNNSKTSGAEQAAKQPARPAPAPTEPASEPMRVGEGELQTPESILYDERDDIYLVSNINGAPLEEDGNGFISRISPDGEVVRLKWIAGGRKEVELDAPKGLALGEEMLFVTDITRLRRFDRRSGEPRGAVEIPGATFANDVVVDKDGRAFVSDSGTGRGGAVWLIPREGKPERIIAGDDLGGPNGLALWSEDEGAVVVVTMRGREMYRIREGKKILVGEAPAGGLDGIVRLDDGYFLVSSWDAGAIYRVDRDGNFNKLVDNLTSPADIGYDTKRERILIPLFQKNVALLHPLPSR